ncbi:MAG: glycosyltransferase, partial [Chitinivibrionales bacterium]|nr:glycosyltransferase [Chitinivibrionales bacterium]
MIYRDRETKSMRKCKVLHVFPSFSVGGVETLTCRIINHFGDRYSHAILSANGDYSVGSRIRPGKHVMFLRQELPPRRFIHAVNFYLSLLRRHNPDLLITNNWGSFECVTANALYKKCSHIHAQHGWTIEEAEKEKLRRLLMRRLFLRNVSFLVVPSSGLAHHACKRWGLPEKKVKVMVNGIDVQRYSSVELPTEKRLVDNSELLIGSVGSLSSIKNHMRLLRVFASIPSTV